VFAEKIMGLEKLNPKEIFELWTNGENINSAIEKYCDKKSIKNSLKNNLADKKDGENGLLAEKTRKLKKRAEFEEYEQALYDDLSDKVRFGVLISIGYEEPIGGSDFPDIISRTAWPPDKINLEYSSITKAGKVFSSIRITENPFSEKKDSSQSAEVPNLAINKKRRGRPSIETITIDVIKKLIASGHIKIDNSQAENIRLVQDMLVMSYKDELELRDDPTDNSRRHKRKIPKGAGYDTVDQLIKKELY